MYWGSGIVSLKKANSLWVSWNEKDFEKQTQRDAFDTRKCLVLEKHKTCLVQVVGTIALCAWHTMDSQ